MTSTAFGKATCSKVNGVPQCGQKLRVANCDDGNVLGIPATSRHADFGTLNQATKGAPLTRRQIEQWQLVSSLGWADVSYRTYPQKHPPVSI